MVQESSASSDRDGQVNEIISAYLEAVDAGQAIDRQEWLRRYPEFAAELEAFLADYEHVDRLAEALRPAAPLVARVPSERVVSGVAKTMGSGQPAGLSVGATVRYVGDYELVEEIARGGMGVVYKARQISLNRIVAVKMILAGHLATKADHDRFHSEAQAVALLDHPNIVPVFEIGEQEGQHYFSMGYVDGQSLAARLADGPLPPNEAAELVATVAAAVEYAHRQGVIHRDIKPSNILIDCEGHPRVTDFGLAKRVGSGSNLTTTGQVLGTPSYMA
ncbi:MAG: serine/threonine-protein kinase, partial [Thermoguttaceae bacterium]